MDSKTNTLPRYLSARFFRFEGTLFRDGKPFRACHSQLVSRISRPCEVAACLRAGEHAGPGGYPLYFVCADGEALTFAAVRQNWREIVSAMLCRGTCGRQIVACEVNWQNPQLYCAHSGERIPSAYAES